MRRVCRARCGHRYCFAMGRNVFEIVVGAEDLARSRFAISPLWELVHAMRALGGRNPAAGPAQAWVDRARDRFVELRRRTDVDAVLALQPKGYGVDFLLPPPSGVATTVDDLLAVVRSTPLDQ